MNLREKQRDKFAKKRERERESDQILSSSPYLKVVLRRRVCFSGCGNGLVNGGVNAIDSHFNTRIY